MTRLVAGIPILLIAAVLAAPRADAPTVPARAVALETPGNTPLLAQIDRYRGRADLVRVAPRTRKPISRAIRLRGGFAWGSAWSPDRRRIAISTSNRSRLQIIDVGRWRSRALIHTTTSALPFVTWPTKNRIVGLGLTDAPPLPLLVIDPTQRKVIRHTTLPGTLVDAAATATGLAVLLASERSRIAPARLALVDQDGETRLIDLAEIRAGREGTQPHGRGLRPALAADPLTGRLYAVAADKLHVTEVDPRTGATTEHDLTNQRSILGRLHDLIEPPAYAKGPSGPARFARVVGPDTLAVTGDDDEGNRITSAGLAFIDTRTWSRRVIEPEVSVFETAGGRVITTDWGRGDRPAIRAYEIDGRLAWSLDVAPVRMEAAGRYAYFSVFRPRHRTYVVDATTGKVVKTLKTASPPSLLPGPR
jgi:hypothetical protein